MDPRFTTLVVHYVSISNGCVNAVTVQGNPAGPVRDLAVFMPGAVASVQGAAYDNDPAEPCEGTWHFPGWCPELGKDAPGRAAANKDRQPQSWQQIREQLPSAGQVPGAPAEGFTQSWEHIDVDLSPDGDGSAMVPGRALVLSPDRIITARYLARVAGSVTAASPVWLRNGDQTIAVIIPPEEYHRPGTCCCSNCPWDGNHADRDKTCQEDPHAPA